MERIKKYNLNMNDDENDKELEFHIINNNKFTFSNDSKVKNNNYITDSLKNSSFIKQKHEQDSLKYSQSKEDFSNIYNDDNKKDPNNIFFEYTPRDRKDENDKTNKFQMILTSPGYSQNAEIQTEKKIKIIFSPMTSFSEQLVYNSSSKSDKSKKSQDVNATLNHKSNQMTESNENNLGTLEERPTMKRIYVEGSSASNDEIRENYPSSKPEKAEVKKTKNTNNENLTEDDLVIKSIYL